MSVEIRATAPSRAVPGAQQARPALTALFAVTSFSGAALLFMVQPMVARLLLPHFGGSASVWSTSNLFFQTLLLVGYLYVHVATRRLGRRAQPVVHWGVLLLPLVALPVTLPVLTGVAESPVRALLTALAVMIGLPFVVVSATGPLLQRWYSWTGLARSEDPYFLFATSNLGSFGGLLAYPFLVEPFMSLEQQRTWWSGGFVLFALLMACCGFLAWNGARADVSPAGVEAPAPQHVPSGVDVPPPSARTVALWLALSFLPSTLSLSVTAHISTDVAAIPLMWVVPLAIYLATFVVAFAKVDRDPGRWPLRLALAAAGTATLASLATAAGLPLALVVALDLVLLAAGAYAAHARLAASRPHPEHLTRFYLVVATGGALGGLLNGVVAPLFFDRVWEYSLAVVGVALLGLGTTSRRGRYHPAFVAVALGLLLWALLLGVGRVVLVLAHPAAWIQVLVLVLCATGVLLAARRPAALALAVAAALATVPLLEGGDLYRDRTFYGSYRVVEDDGRHVLIHGSTVHGIQDMSQSVPEPLSYYGPRGPVGQFFSSAGRPERVGVVGLGVGTVASYVGAGQELTFFEIDPEVVRVAQDPSLFTFLSSSRATVRHVVGDGRVALESTPSGSFDVLMLDAFTSDAIPVHLLTREAFDVYADALGQEGVLLVHITNRMFDLEPVVAQAAEELGWSALVGRGRNVGEEFASTWVALSPDPRSLEDVAALENWRTPTEERTSWTDDFSSLLSVLDVR